MSSDFNINNAIKPKANTKELPTNPDQQRQSAQFIADLILELRNLAKGQNMPALLGLLEVAYYEAFSAANRIEIPPGELEHLEELSRATAKRGR